MSFKDQLRDWLGGLWRDFWIVPFPQLLLFGSIALLIIVGALWRIGAATNSSLRDSYYVFSPLLFMVILGLLGVARRTR